MKLITKIVGATLGLAMAVGVALGVAANNRVARGLNATPETASVTFGSGDGQTNLSSAPNSGSFTDSKSNTWSYSVTGANSKGSAQPGYTQFGNSSNKPTAATVTFTASSAISISALSFGVSSGSGSGSGSVDLTIGLTDVTPASNTYSGNSSATNIVASGLPVTLNNASSVSISVTNTNGSLRFYTLSMTYEMAGGATKLATPEPQYSSSNNEITWEDIENASSYDVTVAGLGTRHNATSPFSTSALPVPGAYTVSVTAIGDGENYIDSSAGTVTFAKLNKAGTEAEPYDIANAKAAIDGGAKVDDVYVTGIISQVDGYNDEHKSITYWISDDGTTTNQFEVFGGKGLNGADFASVGDVEIGATVVVYGSIKLYNSVHEFNSNSQIKSYTNPAAKISVHNQLTTSSLAYHYQKSNNKVTDTITKALTGITGSGYKSWSNVSDSSDARYAGNSNASHAAIQFRKSGGSDPKSAIISTTSGGKISKVSVEWASGNISGRTLNVYGKTTAYTDLGDLYDSNKFGTLLGTIVEGTSTELEVSGSYNYVGIVPSSGAAYLESVSFEWDASSFVYSDVYVGFSGRISKTLWDRLDTESHGIVGYGVMLTEPSVLESEGYDTIEELYRETEELTGIETAREERDGKYYIWDTDVKYFYNPVGENQPRESGDYCVWKLSKGVTNTKKGLTRAYTAVAFIRTTDDGLIFLQETTKSAAQIADDDYTDELDATLEGSLSNLAGLLN